LKTTAGVGISQKIDDSFRSGVEAASAAKSKLKGPFPLAVVFMTEQYDEEKAIEGVRSVTGDTPLIGCTAPSLICNGKIYSDGLGVAIIQSDTLKVNVGVSDNLSQDAQETGRQLGSTLSTVPFPNGHPQNQVLLVFADASMTKGVVTDALYEAFREFGSSFRFFGGGSADNLHFKKSVQILNDQVHRDAITGALIVSDSPQAISLRHGWEPTGRNLVVTKAEGKTVHELDGQPALELYMSSLDEDIKGFDFSQFYGFASGHPLGIPMATGEYIVRDPLSASVEDNSITFVSEVPENAIVRIMTGSRESLLLASTEAAGEAKEALGGKAPALILIADCVSRLLFLGDDAQTEVSNIGTQLGGDVPMLGFFSFGEIGIEKGGPPALYNKTCGVYALPE
jgi:hypothetical protein